MLEKLVMPVNHAAPHPIISQSSRGPAHMRACIVEGMSASDDSLPNDGLQANTPFYTRRSWCWSFSAHPHAGIGFQWRNKHEVHKTGCEVQTWPGYTHRHAATLNCNLSVSLRQPPVKHQPQKGTTAAHRPPTAKWRIRVDVNPNLTYHIIARPGLGTMLHPLPRGDPGILTMLTDTTHEMHAICMSFPKRVIPSYLAAEVARCQHHHSFISMQARRIMGSNSRVFHIGPLPNSHYTGENGE